MQIWKRNTCRRLKVHWQTISKSTRQVAFSYEATEFFFTAAGRDFLEISLTFFFTAVIVFFTADGISRRRMKKKNVGKMEIIKVFFLPPPAGFF